ncbi:MAG TPA: hypothetical protein VK663_12130, partial [Burkholderiales bacterium]|nr:hypothetical protein [Burkholderiales bacterium]
GHHGGSAMNGITEHKEANGTSILDVTDPRRPRYVHHLPTSSGDVVAGGEGGGAQMVQICAGKDLPQGDPSNIDVPLASFCPVMPFIALPP